MIAAKRVLRYLKGTIDTGLEYYGGQYDTKRIPIQKDTTLMQKDTSLGYTDTVDTVDTSLRSSDTTLIQSPYAYTVHLRAFTDADWAGDLDGRKC
jgi:hypothetical protein